MCLLFIYFLVGRRNQKGCGVDSGEKAGVQTLHHPLQAHPNYLPRELGSPVSPFVQSFDRELNTLEARQSFLSFCSCSPPLPKPQN